MKKIGVLLMLLVLSGLMINCGQAPPPQNSFRLKTRIKFRLFGFIPLFGVALPYQRINLKTNSTAGAPGTTGTKTEFDLGGNFVSTDHVGKFDAVDAVLPATWIVKADPNQILRFPCQYAPMQTFQAIGGKTYKYKCNLDVINNLVSTPDSIYVNIYGIPDTGSNPQNWATTTKGLHNQSFFKNAENLTIQFYRYTGTDSDGEEEYELESSASPKSTSADGTTMTMYYPNGWRNPTGYLVNNTTKIYRVIVVEDNVYIGHTTFQIDYPERTCETPHRVCP